MAAQLLSWLQPSSHGRLLLFIRQEEENFRCVEINRSRRTHGPSITGAAWARDCGSAGWATTPVRVISVIQV